MTDTAKQLAAELFPRDDEAAGAAAMLIQRVLSEKDAEIDRGWNHAHTAVEMLLTIAKAFGFQDLENPPFVVNSILNQWNAVKRERDDLRSQLEIIAAIVGEPEDKTAPLAYVHAVERYAERLNQVGRELERAQKELELAQTPTAEQPANGDDMGG